LFNTSLTILSVVVANAEDLERFLSIEFNATELLFDLMDQTFDCFAMTRAWKVELEKLQDYVQLHAPAKIQQDFVMMGDGFPETGGLHDHQNLSNRWLMLWGR
jgi:hypothetical protein